MTPGQRAAELQRMATQFEVEALGEAQWLSNVHGTDTATARALARVALIEAARQLKERKP